MTILWGGGEDESFLTGFTLMSNGGTFRSGYARHATYCDSNNEMLKSAVFAATLTSGWISARIWKQGSGQDCPHVLGFGKSSGEKGIFAGLNTDNPSKVTISKYDGSSNTLLATGASGVVLNSTLYKVDVQLINYGGSGTVNVYIDGVLAVTYTGDLSITDVSNFDSIYGLKSPNVSNEWFAGSEFIASDTDTRTLSLVTHYETGAGDVDDWEGAYTDIDEETINDADLISTPTADEDFQAAMSNVPAGSFIVPAIIVKARATKSIEGSAVGTLKLGVKSGGTIDVDAGHALTTSWVTYERIAATINGGAMTTTLLDAMQLDLRSAA